MTFPYFLRADIESVARSCPLCGWQAPRRLKSGWPGVEHRIPDFLQRCQDDIGAHLIDAHHAVESRSELVA